MARILEEEFQDLFEPPMDKKHAKIITKKLCDFADEHETQGVEILKGDKYIYALAISIAARVKHFETAFEKTMQVVGAIESDEDKLAELEKHLRTQVSGKLIAGIASLIEAHQKGKFTINT